MDTRCIYRIRRTAYLAYNIGVNVAFYMSTAVWTELATHFSLFKLDASRGSVDMMQSETADFVSLPPPGKHTRRL